MLSRRIKSIGVIMMIIRVMIRVIIGVIIRVISRWRVRIKRMMDGD